MNFEEIKTTIDKLIKENEEFYMKGQFTLNNQIRKNRLKIEKLQKSCPHSYENGVCKYCYKMEEQNGRNN